MTALLRSLLFVIIFYTGSLFVVGAAVLAVPFGQDAVHSRLTHLGFVAPLVRGTLARHSHAPDRDAAAVGRPGRFQARIDV
jgi:hypothetical protein